MSTTKEKIKNVLICLLLVGMVYLTYTVWFFDSPFESTGIGDLFGIDVRFENADEGVGTDLDTFGIRPMSIYVKGEGYSRGAVYESAKTDTAYKLLRDGIVRVMNSSGEIKSADESAWKEAISGDGVLLDYFGNVPFGAICAWLGTNSGEDAYSGRYYMISAEERSIKLYIKNTDRNEVYLLNTSASSEDFMAVAAGIDLSDAFLAGESDESDFVAVSAETVVVSAPAKPPAVSAYNSYATFSASIADACLEAFSLRDVSPGTYSEADGTQVYIADMVTMKISPAGLVSYTDPRDEIDETIGISAEHEGEHASLAEKTETARSIAASLAAKIPGTGGIYLMSAEESGDESEIVFGRHIGGIPVNMSSSTYFVRVNLRGDMVSDVRANLRGYDLTAQSADALSLRLAAAAASGAGKKGDISLRYPDAGINPVSPSWFITLEKEKEDGNELVEG
ncbi:MAG: hypothetical protein IJ299_03965 [Oscillospiraceae bacterium]|nr:hypothetical protein [Oscillospiraceae bacterium]